MIFEPCNNVQITFVQSESHCINLQPFKNLGNTYLLAIDSHTRTNSLDAQHQRVPGSWDITTWRTQLLLGARWGRDEAYVRCWELNRFFGAQ